MSENPFKIIRSTDQPPADLKKEVVGSVKFMMLLLRFVQLFVADPGSAIFEKIRLAGRSTSSRTPNLEGSSNAPTNTD